VTIKKTNIKSIRANNRRFPFLSLRKGRKWYYLLGVLFVTLLVLLVSPVSIFQDPAKLKKHTPEQTALMIFRQKEAQDSHESYRIQKKFIPLRQIHPLLREAVQLSEDASFYAHDGFDFDEMEKAIALNIKRKKMIRGASTISQQLIKNLYLSVSKNPFRKLTEALLTIRLEQRVSKDRILELYLNLIEWGDGIFGIEMAAKIYFKETAMTLTPAHAVLLAAMLPMPLHVNPLYPSVWLKRRAQRLLKELYIKHRLSNQEYQDAKKQIGTMNDM